MFGPPKAGTLAKVVYRRNPQGVPDRAIGRKFRGPYPWPGRDRTSTVTIDPIDCSAKPARHLQPGRAKARRCQYGIWLFNGDASLPAPGSAAKSIHSIGMSKPLRITQMLFRAGHRRSSRNSAPLKPDVILLRWKPGGAGSVHVESWHFKTDRSRNQAVCLKLVQIAEHASYGQGNN